MSKHFSWWSYKLYITNKLNKDVDKYDKICIFYIFIKYIYAYSTIKSKFYVNESFRNLFFASGLLF